MTAPDLAALVGDGALPPRARFTTDAPVLDLGGAWAIRWSPSPLVAPQDFGSEDLDDTGWPTVPVPSSLPMQGWGAPWYTNTRFPFPVDPPAVPDENPVADLRRRFDWDGGDAAVLRFDGIDATGEVVLNGVRLGSTAGSRLVHEFDATGVLRARGNVLAVRVVQWAPTSYLEDQDMWWLPGVFRDVTLQAAPAGGVHDVRVRASFDGGRAVLRVDADTRDAAAAVVDVLAFGLSGLPTGVEHEVRGAPGWTAETPELVEVRVSTASEAAVLRVGFRTIAIEDAQLKVDGRRIRIRGVNRHESHPDLGRVVPAEVVRAELLLMKQHHVNAIRTSHYPPHPDLPGLADELGFYLIDECDLETHGFIHVGWRGNPSDDPDWEPALLDRMRRTIARDRNHPSVILWSLGNEAGHGRNLEAMAALAHELDPGRPVHYEGDWSSRYVDVYSRMYALQAEVDAIGRQAEAPLPDPADDAHRRAQPFLLCEYAHAMGNGPGGLDEYEVSFRTHPRTQGGFVWEWLEHGIRARTADGREFYRYGGDFGEELHDGNFVADGLVDADRRPRPGLADWAAVVAPVTLRIADDRRSIEVRNGFDFADLGGVGLAWVVGEGTGAEVRGEAALPAVPAGATATVPLPPTPDGPLTVTAVLLEDTAWAPRGHGLGGAQRGTLPVPVPPEPSVAPVQVGEELRLGPAAFDARSGRLLRLGDVEAPGPVLSLWRAPTDNDRGVGTDRQALPSDAASWELAGLDRLRARVVAVEHEPAALVVTTAVGPAAADHRVVVRSRWTSDGEALRLDVALEPQGPWPFGWARAGLELLLPWTPDRIAWDGYGPGQRYPDTGQAQRLGHWEVGGPAALHTDYVRPQENGSRSGVTVVELTREGRGFRVEGAGFAFTASPWTSPELAAAAHPVELPASDRCRLTLDLAEHGIGTASCGPGVLAQHRLDPRPIEATLTFRPR